MQKKTFPLSWILSPLQGERGFKNKKAFTLVEILISIAILVVLSFIAFSSYDSYQNSANSSKTKADLGTLKNALESYIEIEKQLPEPKKWNKNYFDKDSAYSHTASGAFWVYWSATKDLLNSKYIDFVPVDPRLKVYYSYGKILDSKNLEFELAWVIKRDDKFMTMVSWNYKAESWPINLIREYNWPEFVYDNSEENFPYNPYEKKLTAKIKKITWTSVTVKIDWKTYNNSNEIKKLELFELAEIETGAGSSAEIYFSDWSVSILEENSKLELENMAYPEDNSLFTAIKLFLSKWKILTQATRLWDDSEFSIETSDAATAVRWTIFSVERDSKTIVKLIEWKVQVKKNWGASWFFPDIPLIMNPNWIIEVSKWESPKWIKLWISSSSETVSPDEKIFFKKFSKITKNNRVELVSYSRYWNKFEIKLKDISFANNIRFNWSSVDLNSTNKKFRQWNFIIINENNYTWWKNDWNLKIQLCKTNDNTECTKELIVKNINKVDYGVEWSDMTAYEEFFKPSLGKWEMEEEGDSITLTGSDYSWTKESWYIPTFSNNSVTMKWYNYDWRWWVYQYEPVDNVKNYLSDINEPNIDYKVELTLSWSRDASYELFFHKDSTDLLTYTSNSKIYFQNSPYWYDDQNNNWHYNNTWSTYFNWEEWKNYENGNYVAHLENDGYFYNKSNTQLTDWWKYIYKFNKPIITQTPKKISFYLKKEFWDTIFTKDILKNLTNIQFNINKTFPWTNEQTKVTISNFKITKVKKIQSSDFKLVAYAPYNTVEKLNLFNSGATNYESNTLTSTWILNWETTTKFSEICNDLSNEWSSLCQVGKTKGVFIDSENNNNSVSDKQDSLTYSWLDLNSWSWFVIEMSVRGEDLDRKSTTESFYLFDWNPSWTWTWAKLFMKSWFLRILSTEKIFKNWSKKESKSLSKINIENKNKFYKVILVLKNGNIALFINNKNIPLQYNKFNWDITINNLDIWNLNLASLHKNQWNSIIDYLKIYKIKSSH